MGAESDVVGVFEQRARSTPGTRSSLRTGADTAVRDLGDLTGAKSYRQIQRFIGVHLERLNAVFGTHWKRALAHTALRHLLHGVQEGHLYQALRRHSRRLILESKPCTSVRIAMDGKALRGSLDYFLDQ